MARIRSLYRAAEKIKQKDPGTSLNYSALRRLVKMGKIRGLDSGKATLVDLDEVERVVLSNADN